MKVFIPLLVTYCLLFNHTINTLLLNKCEDTDINLELFESLIQQKPKTMNE